MKRLALAASLLAVLASHASAEPKRRSHRARKAKTEQVTPEGSPSEVPAPGTAAAAVQPAPAAQAASEEAPPAAPPQGDPAVKVSSKLDKEALQVGEVATLSIEVEGPSSIEPSLPEQKFGGLELIGRDLKTQVEGDRTRTTFSLQLLALEAGEVTIGAQELRLVGANGELSKAYAPPQHARVSSLIANEPNAEPKPPTQPVAVMQDDYTLAWVGLGLLAVALVVAATLLISRWLKRRPKPVAPPPPPRPAWDIALERLQQLAEERERAFAEQRGAQFVEAVSATLREYLGRRYGFDGLERTTHELMVTLEELRPHALSLTNLALLLEQCDLIKFARATPDAAYGQELLSGAFALVKTTTPTGHSLPPAALAQESAR